jgi:hypothetical protein
MRSHLRSENIRRIAEMKPGVPYMPFEPDEFQQFGANEYAALPELPCVAPGWRLLSKEDGRTELNAVTWASDMVRIFRVAENEKKTIGLMRHPGRDQVVIFCKVR